MNTNTTTAIAALAALFTANGMDANTANNLATLNIDLETRLANGAVTFTFTKKDGTTRTAVGTNKPTIVPNFYTFKGSTARANNAVLAYYDLEKNAFRSFRKENLVSIAAA